MDDEMNGNGMRSAFVITSHADVPQLARLVRVLIADRTDVRAYISHDVAGAPGVERIASESCRVVLDRGGRGDFSQVDRVLGLLEAVERDGGADFVTVLSGADYPARPIEEFLDALDASGDGMLHHFRALDRRDSDWRLHESRQRYLYRWRALGVLEGAARARWHWLHGLNYLQPFVRVNVSYGTLRIGTYRGRLPAGLQCHGGSAWFSLSRRAVRHVVGVVRSRPDIMRWGRESIAIDEAFFQSILLSDGKFDFVNDNGRYIDFADDGFGHPRVLTEEDAEAIERSQAFFARKIDSRRSAALLDHLHERIGAPPSAGTETTVPDHRPDVRTPSRAAAHRPVHLENN